LWSGVYDAGAMFLNAATFHQNDQLNNYVNQQIQQNGGTYQAANVAMHVGEYALYAAGGIWIGRTVVASISDLQRLFALRQQLQGALRLAQDTGNWRLAGRIARDLERLEAEILKRWNGWWF
jgi:hypothetical protein